jgi:hypothetical protein
MGEVQAGAHRLGRKVGAGDPPVTSYDALPPLRVKSPPFRAKSRLAVAPLQRAKGGAGDRVRTGDVHLGKVAFYR